MPTLRPGNKSIPRKPFHDLPRRRGVLSGSILVDAIVAVLIVATLGVAIVAAVSSSYSNLARYDEDLRTALDDIHHGYSATW